MATTADASDTAAAARTQILSELRNDHKRVRKAYRDFRQLDIHEDPTHCSAIVRRVLSELALHAALEEELLYPALRGSVDDDLLDQAEVEHETLRTLIESLGKLSPVEDKFAARFTVLCKHVLHHVKDEEGEIFPRLQTVDLDWVTLAAHMLARRNELTGDAAPAPSPNQGADAS